MIEYRIVSNGIDYRIQWLGKSLILRRPKWKWLRCYCYAGDWIAEFNTREEAEAALKVEIKKDEAREHGYQPI